MSRPRVRGTWPRRARTGAVDEEPQLLVTAAAKLDEAGWNDEFSPELTRGVEAAARAALGDAAFESALAVGRGDAVAPV